MHSLSCASEEKKSKSVRTVCQAFVLGNSLFKPRLNTLSVVQGLYELTTLGFFCVSKVYALRMLSIKQRGTIF